MAEQLPRGVGKCASDHLGSYGYPTRPDHPYGFCAQCGTTMVWECPGCHASMPSDPDELSAARFCRECGHGYFGEAPGAPAATDGQVRRVVSARDEPGHSGERVG